MKDRERKPGIFSKLLLLVVHNWGLKLLSLALAILIYYSLKPSATSGTAARRTRTGRETSPVEQLTQTLQQTGNVPPPAVKNPPAVKK